MTGDLANAVPRIRREFDNELGNRITITIDGPTSRSENILTPREATELRNGLDEMEQALAADREKLVALGADPGPTEDEFFSNGIMDLNSALALAEDMTEAPGYGDMQDALGVLAKAYRKAEDRIGELIAANDAKAAALKDAREALEIACSRGCDHCARSIRRARAAHDRLREEVGMRREDPWMFRLGLALIACVVLAVGVAIVKLIEWVTG